MPPDVANMVEVITMGLAVTSPSSIVEDSNTVSIETLSHENEALDTLKEAFLDDTSSPSATDILKMALSESLPPESRKVAISLGFPSRTAPPSLTIGKPSPGLGEIYSPRPAEYIVSIEHFSAMDPSSSKTDILTSSSGLLITRPPEIQEPSVFAETSPNIDSPRKTTETTPTELPELPFGPFPKDASEITSPSIHDDASDSFSEAMNFCSPEGEDVSDFAKGQSDMPVFSSDANDSTITTQVGDMDSVQPSEVNIQNDLASTEDTSGLNFGAMELSPSGGGVISEALKDQPSMDSSSPETALANMTSEVVKDKSSDLHEATISDHLTSREEASGIVPETLEHCPSNEGVQSEFKEDKPNVNSAFSEALHASLFSEIIHRAEAQEAVISNYSSSAERSFDALPEALKFCPSEGNFQPDFTKDPPIPPLSEAVHTQMTSAMNEMIPIGSPETILPNHLTSAENPSNTIFSSPEVGTINKVDGVLESVLKEVIELNRSCQVANDCDPACLEFLDAKVKNAPVETNSTEVLHLDSTATLHTISPGEDSTLCAPEESNVVSSPLDEKPDCEKHFEFTEVPSDVNFRLLAPGELNKESENIENSLPNSPELSPDSELNSGGEAASRVPDSSMITDDSTVYVGLTELQGHGITMFIHSALAGDDISNAPESVDTTTTNILNTIYSAENLDPKSPSGTIDISPVVVERSEMIRRGMEGQTSSASTSPLSSPTISITNMDFDFESGEITTPNAPDLGLPDAAIPNMELSIVDSTTISDIFDSNVGAAGEQFASKSPPNNSFLFPGDRDLGSEFDETKFTESSGLFSSVSEHMGMRMSSPEIKAEPMSVDDLPYLDILPSVTTSSSTSPEPTEPPSSMVKGEEVLSEVLLDTIPLADIHSLTMVGEDIRAISSEIKLESHSVDVAHYDEFHNIRKKSVSKSPRKRVHFAIEGEKEVQQPPAKKLRQEVFATCDVPQLKTEAENFPEENAVAPFDVPQLSNPNDTTRTMISPPSSPVELYLNIVKTEVTDVEACGSSFSIVQSPHSSIDRTSEGQKMLPISTSNFTEIPGPKVKMNPANDTVELRVGPSGKCILAHKHILSKSPFFASLLSQYPNLKESLHAYHFRHFDTYAFATVVHWLYHGDIRFIAEEYKADDIFNTTHMVKVYCLCQKLQLRSLQNLAIELLGHGYLKNNSAPTIEEIDIAYSGTEQSSTIRFYLATWAQYREHVPLQIYMMARPWDQARFKILCQKHSDLSITVENLNKSTGSLEKKSINPQVHPICWYHDHLEGESCGVANQTFQTACSGIRFRISEPI
ncbi:hypothetical protein V8E51_015100 [Hyaloscypha variabilis]